MLTQHWDHSEYEKWQEQGYNSVLEPTLPQIPCPVPYVSIKRFIQGLISQGALPINSVKFVHHSEHKLILFKYSFAEIKAIFFKYHDGKTSIDIKKPGRDMDSFRGNRWSLKNILQTINENNAKESAEKHFKNLKTRFLKLHRSIHPDKLLKLSLQPEFLAEIYSCYNGLVLGEVHSDQTPKQFIINHAQHLKTLGIEIMFLEHFTQGSQPRLDEFFRTGILSKDLEAYVDSLDENQGLLGKPFCFKNLLYALQEAGIRPVGIETATSIVISGALDGEFSKRLLCMNHAFKLTAEQTLTSPHMKWIALTGSAHATTRCDVPGISELFNSPCMIISDTKDQQSLTTAKPATDMRTPAGQILLELKLTENIPQVPQTGIPHSRPKITRTGTEILNLMPASHSKKRTLAPKAKSEAFKDSKKTRKYKSSL